MGDYIGLLQISEVHVFPFIKGQHISHPGHLLVFVPSPKKNCLNKKIPQGLEMYVTLKHEYTALWNRFLQ